MVSMAAWASVAPGIWMRIWFAPWRWTVASLAPREFTRLVTIATAESMSASVTALPSGLLAVMMTETPPWISKPWVIFWSRGVNPTTHTANTTRSTTRVPT